MNCKPAVLSLLCIFLGSICRAQEAGHEFNAYMQKIPNSAVSFKMIPIAGGSFTMGSPGGEHGRHPDEGPQAVVQVDSFWMEEHEVTYDEYILFSDADRDSEPKPDGITRPSPPYIDFTLGMGKDGGFPANSMSQYAALMYCQWLYKKTGIFYRLPTEAEWEYACRAGSKGAYFFGDQDKDLGEYAWYKQNSGDKYHKVMEKKPNAWGLYDMTGNVAEWTLDQYEEDYFKQLAKPAINPWSQPVAKQPRTLKGGNFKDDADALRSAARLKSDPKWNARDPQIPKSKWWNADAPFIGFRIVRPLKQPSAEEVEKFFTQVLLK